MEGSAQLLTCQFSPTGNYMAAGGSDCCTYMWAWDVNADGHVALPGWKLPGRRADTVHLGKAPSPDDVAKLSAWWGEREWPPVVEVAKLECGRNDVTLVEFSRGGNRLCAASKDGVLKVYRQ